MAVYQVQREQLTDGQWADLSRLFACAKELKRRVEERRAAGMPAGRNHAG